MATLVGIFVHPPWWVVALAVVGLFGTGYWLGYRAADRQWSRWCEVKCKVIADRLSPAEGPPV